MNIAGFRRENIDLAINEAGNRIQIRGKKAVQEIELMGWIMHKKEVEIRAFGKIFIIPDGVALNKIKAKFDDETSTLTIKMPKLEKGFISRTGIEEVKEESDSCGEGEGMVNEKVSGDKNLEPEEFPERDIVTRLTEKRKPEKSDSTAQRVDGGEEMIDEQGPEERHTMEETISLQEEIVPKGFPKKDEISREEEREPEENDREERIDGKVPGEEETPEDKIPGQEEEFDEKSEGGKLVPEFPEIDKTSTELEKQTPEETDVTGQRVESSKEDNQVENDPEGVGIEVEHQANLETKREPTGESNGSQITEPLETEKKEKIPQEATKDGLELAKSGEERVIQEAKLPSSKSTYLVGEKNISPENYQTESKENKGSQRQELQYTDENKESTKPEIYQEPKHEGESQLADHHQLSDDEESVGEKTGEKASGEENVPEDEFNEHDGSSQADERKKLNPLTVLTGPLLAAGSAIIVSLIVLVFHFVRSKKK